MPDNQDPNVIITSSHLSLFKILAMMAVILLLTLLGFLVSKKLIKKPLPAPVKESKITLPCPIPSYCSKLKPIMKNDHLIAFGTNIATNSAIMAVFDGKIVKRSINLSSKIGSEKFYEISLINDQKKLKAIYFLKNKPLVKSAFKEKERIATESGQTINYFNNNFAFVLLDNKDQPVPLANIEFK